MQHTTDVAVVATQLADTDRRALSQAWYSALHLAEQPPAARPAALAPSPAASDGARCTRGPNDAAQSHSTQGAGGPRDAARSATTRHAGEAAGPERRAPKADLARRAERGPARRPPRGATASFTVAGAGERVHVVVRSDGRSTRILAVCAPPLRERVERALAHARFALAGYDVRAEVA